MAKSGKSREVEYWKGIVRKLQKEIRELKKPHRRKFSKDIVITIDEPEERPVPIKKNLCAVCGKGNVSTTDLGNRKLHSCDTCRYLKSEKK